MASGDVTLAVGGQIRFCVSGSFSPADAGTNETIGSPTNVALTLASLASGSARASDKVDLGATRPEGYEVKAAVDFTGETPTQGARVDFYWAPSPSGTAGTGNVMGMDGVDGASAFGALGSATLADVLAACDYIGSLQVHDGAVVQNGLVCKEFCPSSRYGQLIVVNNSGDVFENDDVENHVVFNPILRNVAAS